MNLSEIRATLIQELDTLEFEIQTLERVFYEANFFNHQSNFPHAHYGYLMVCMGKIDVLSAYWKGVVSHKGQTKRMRDFMNTYLHPGKTQEHNVAIQMFRHTLMHTGALRFLYDRTTNIKYTWRVHFGRSLPPGMHYTITSEDEHYQDQLMKLAVSNNPNNPSVKALNLNIVLLVSDIKRALVSYIRDLEIDTNLLLNYRKAAPRIEIQEFNS